MFADLSGCQYGGERGGDLLTEVGGGEDGDRVEWMLEVEERRARGEKK